MVLRIDQPPPGLPVATPAQSPGPAGAVRPARTAGGGDPVQTPDAGVPPKTLRSILAAAAAHELRSTLALVSGYSQSLQHLALDAATRRQYLERIISAATTLTECADELVGLADDERPALQREPIAISWLIEHAARELTAGDSGEVTCDVVPGLPLVEVDAAWVLHVIRNLVTNARRHGAGSTGVTIRARGAGDSVIVSVQDEGPGVDPEDRPHVFEPFYRGARARTTGVPGSGIGLYVCRRLVEAHGGEIWFDPAPSGTSISFSLPLWHASDGEHPVPIAEDDPLSLG